jgi:hypothetical protein
MTQLYCLVENNVVTQGPVPLPKAFGNMTGFDHVADPTVYNWFPYSDPGAPSFDLMTQRLTRSFTINAGAKTVTQGYTVTPLDLPIVQANQQRLVEQSYAAKQRLKAQAAAKAGDTQSAMQYLLKGQPQ